MIGSVTPDAMAADARAFFAYLAGRPEVTGEAFGTTGYCMGGRTSLTVAGRVPERVAAAMSFHGGGLASEEGQPASAGRQVTAAVYVGGAQDDASFHHSPVRHLGQGADSGRRRPKHEWYPAAIGLRGGPTRAYDEAAAGRHWDAMRILRGPPTR